MQQAGADIVNVARSRCATAQARLTKRKKRCSFRVTLESEDALRRCEKDWQEQSDAVKSTTDNAKSVQFDFKTLYERFKTSQAASHDKPFVDAFGHYCTALCVDKHDAKRGQRSDKTAAQRYIAKLPRAYKEFFESKATPLSEDGDDVATRELELALWRLSHTNPERRTVDAEAFFRANIKLYLKHGTTVNSKHADSSGRQGSGDGGRGGRGGDDDDGSDFDAGSGARSDAHPAVDEQGDDGGTILDHGGNDSDEGSDCDGTHGVDIASSQHIPPAFSGGGGSGGVTLGSPAHRPSAAPLVCPQRHRVPRHEPLASRRAQRSLQCPVKCAEDCGGRQCGDGAACNKRRNTRHDAGRPRGGWCSGRCCKRTGSSTIPAILLWPVHVAVEGDARGHSGARLQRPHHRRRLAGVDP